MARIAPKCCAGRRDRLTGNACRLPPPLSDAVLPGHRHEKTALNEPRRFFLLHGSLRCHVADLCLLGSSSVNGGSSSVHSGSGGVNSGSSSVCSSSSGGRSSVSGSGSSVVNGRGSSGSSSVNSRSGGSSSVSSGSSSRSGLHSSVFFLAASGQGSSSDNSSDQVRLVHFFNPSGMYWVRDNFRKCSLPDGRRTGGSPLLAPCPAL